MKKQLCRSITSVIVLFITLLPGCKKATDFLKDNPSAAFCPCQIRQFNFEGEFYQDTVRFGYNAAGDPVSAIRTHPGTGNPNWFFRYDRHGRLTDLIGRYGALDEGGAERWNRYFYDAQGRIVKDSAYDFPGVVDDRPTIDPVYLTGVEIALYEYDHKDRVSKETFISANFTLVTNYTYDAHGNRMEPAVIQTSGAHSNLAARTYDDKINYHRTSKVWMFVDKDYSVNNPLTATYDYNGFGLPITIVSAAGVDQNFLSVSHASYAFTRATIKYNCQGAL